MNDIRCLVVDDEPLATDIVVHYLERLAVHTIRRAGNGVDAFRLLRQEQVDLLFLDIRMPQLSGFDLLRSLPQRPIVVITSAYRDYAVEGFEWEVLDYLVKPFSFPRFLQTMEKVTRMLPSAAKHTAESPRDQKNIIFLKTDRQWTRVPVESILYIESLKDYIRVVTTNGEYICHQPLTGITASLPAGRFLRVHRSYTVAIDKVDQVRQHCAYIGSSAIPVSRAHRHELYSHLNR
ncbi:MAG TPA: LytTR family DNA-binding domain-containing protein [Puia sp.]|nr:LytTR family DNA-binding domain-containing protein [Puia sp.]